ncbi:hypothetical protein M3Y95_01134200 [Aphelenchoides besseyi]|nr:hypothetical protein M3Y95_01134200 [Aphelenchoides besseyi]
MGCGVSKSRAKNENNQSAVVSVKKTETQAANQTSNCEKTITAPAVSSQVQGKSIQPVDVKVVRKSPTLCSLVPLQSGAQPKPQPSSDDEDEYENAAWNGQAPPQVVMVDGKSIHRENDRLIVYDLKSHTEATYDNQKISTDPVLQSYSKLLDDAVKS